MTHDAGKPPQPKPQVTEKDVREARRKEALKANMARRKAQVRARAAPDKTQAAGMGADPFPDKE